jgi:hypothetical protein
MLSNMLQNPTCDLEVCGSPLRVCTIHSVERHVALLYLRGGCVFFSRAITAGVVLFVLTLVATSTTQLVPKSPTALAH